MDRYIRVRPCTKIGPHYVFRCTSAMPCDIVTFGGHIILSSSPVRFYKKNDLTSICAEPMITWSIPYVSDPSCDPSLM